MMSLLLVLLLTQEPAVVVAPAADASPTAAAPASTPVAPAAGDDENRLICVMETQTGSYFSKKTCLTKAQWKKRRESRRSNAERALTADTNTGTGN